MEIWVKNWISSYLLKISLKMNQYYQITTYMLTITTTSLWKDGIL